MLILLVCLVLDDGDLTTEDTEGHGEIAIA